MSDVQTCVQLVAYGGCRTLGDLWCEDAVVTYCEVRQDLLWEHAKQHAEYYTLHLYLYESEPDCGDRQTLEEPLAHADSVQTQLS